jgi:hypothetical protein
MGSRFRRRRVLFAIRGTVDDLGRGIGSLAGEGNSLRRVLALTKEGAFLVMRRRR